MDFLIELLVQFVVQVIGEIIFEAIWHRLADAFRTRVGRYLLTSLVGAASGFGWGWHLAGQPHPPKLLWVSIALGVASLLRSRHIAKADDGSVSFPALTPWREALASPRTWPAERWRDFVVLNAAIAAGVLGGYLVG